MISLEELRLRVGLAPSDGDDDALLERLERAAVAHVERRTNLYFGATASLTERLSGGRRPKASVRLRAPIVSITSVETLGASFIGGTWTEPWALSDFSFAAGERALFFADATLWPVGRNNIRITYQGGYTAGSEPLDVRDAVGAIVAETYRRARRAVAPVTTEGETDAGLAVPADAAAVLKSWYRSPGT